MAYGFGPVSSRPLAASPRLQAPALHVGTLRKLRAGTTQQLGQLRPATGR